MLISLCLLAYAYLAYAYYVAKLYLGKQQLSNFFSKKSTTYLKQQGLSSVTGITFIRQLVQELQRRTTTNVHSNQALRSFMIYLSLQQNSYPTCNLSTGEGFWFNLPKYNTSNVCKFPSEL
jgi:hypothetical protein